MKRLMTVLGLVLLAGAASAQTMYDGLNYSREDNYGTARTMAMGNAMVAVGGDLGSISINPAGSAVASYSQFSVTAGANISRNTAQGTTLSGGAAPFCFDNLSRNVRGRFTLPNIGYLYCMNTGRSFGLVSWSLAATVDTRTSYQDYTFASGVHNGTSIAGSLSMKALGTPYTALDETSAYDNHVWPAVLGWKSGMISTVNGVSDVYVGATEKYIQDEEGNRQFFTAGALNQEYARRIIGGKTDYIVNGGINVSNIFYLGATLGAQTMNYVFDDYIKEKPVNESEFDIDFGAGGTTYFKDLKYQTWYTARGSGVYAKLGIIVTPGPLRIGASVQTRTSLTITEKWGSSAQTNYANSSFNGSASTPEGSYKYTFKTPWRANVGIAGTIASMAVLSLDYEVAFNRSMKFSSLDYASNEFDSLNSSIKDCMGSTQQLRAGTEVKPLDWLSVRAGYNLTALRSGYGKNSTIASSTTLDHSVSFGLGFSTRGSFFADIACKSLFCNKEYIYPYDDYDFDADGNIIHYTPEIKANRQLFTLAATIGFRF